MVEKNNSKNWTVVKEQADKHANKPCPSDGHVKAREGIKAISTNYPDSCLPPKDGNKK